MHVLKKYKIVILVILPILVMVLIKLFSSYPYKYDVQRWIHPTLNNSNLITKSMIDSMKGNVMIVELNDSAISIKNNKKDVLHFPPTSIFEKEYIGKIQKHKGPVILYSENPAVSARVWVILSQMGYKNLFILTDSVDNEVIKCKFQPDTIIRYNL
jgi:hypothetical protein